MSEPESPPPESLRDPLLLASQPLFQARTMLVFGEITAQIAERACAQLLALAAISSEPIKLFLNSPGGHVESGDSIHDMIRFIDREVTIVASGWVASAGALIFCAAPRERRIALPNTRFMLHEPSGGFRGNAAEIEIEAVQVLAMRARLNAIFARATGQSLDKIASDTARNYWLSADDARAYGLLGRIVEHSAEL